MEDFQWPNNFKEFIELIIQNKITILMINQKFKEIINKAEDENYNNKNIINIDKNNIFDILYNFDNMLDFKRNISYFILSFMSALPYNIGKNYNKFKSIIDTFLSLKKENLIESNLKDINYPNDKCINLLFSITPNFLQDLQLLFDFNDIILDSIDILSKEINNQIENSYNIMMIKKYIIFYIKKIEANGNDEIKNKLINGIHFDKLINHFFSNSDYKSLLTQFFELLKYFPSFIEPITKILIEKREIKQITKYIIKENLFKYLTDETLNNLKFINEKSTFNFFLHSYEEKTIRLINFYDLYYDKNVFIEKLSNYLKEKNKIRQSELILNKQYTEELDMELEEYDDNIGYITLNETIIDNIKFISSSNIEEGINILYKMKFYDLFGIDSEWKPMLSIFEEYFKENKSDIIQIACEDYICILDTQSFINEEKLKNAFYDVFNNKIFIGFFFSSDIREMNIFFKQFFQNQKIIDLKDVYNEKYKKKCPDLNTICKMFLNKNLNKIDQLSNWRKRPLNINQIKYSALDAYILILLYNKMSQSN